MVPDVLQHAQAIRHELNRSVSLVSGGKIPLLSRTETAEEWLKYEQLVYSCLVTGDEESASSCLKLLEQRFGESNEKVQSIRGVYEESKASGRDIDDVLRGYEKKLKENPANFPIAKRRITLLKSTGKEQEAITALCKLLDLSPTDVESWAELAELYYRRTMYKQAVFCLEEVLLAQPNAWNVHTRIGEVLLKTALTMTGDKQKLAETLEESLVHFCRSVELCKDYVRGYCGIKQSSTRLLLAYQENQKIQGSMSLKAVEKLRNHATERLQSIIGKYSADTPAPPEILAAKAFLEA